ncbi:MAG: GYD domain-containing protein [Acidobacteria bacterium]|nr:MAG: GYD domain-containing protein [Acidobacteriota bacterium]MCE7957056.1 GYD domain-containing protein [Acidobacteria bacterium ACB2]
MATYVLMTKLSPDALQGSAGRRETGHGWKKKVEELCPGIRWVAHYALLGPYDFMDVYEAPDGETAFRVSLLSREWGAVSAESWPAMPYERFLAVADTVEKK